MHKLKDKLHDAGSSFKREVRHRRDSLRDRVGDNENENDSQRHPQQGGHLDAQYSSQYSSGSSHWSSAHPASQGSTSTLLSPYSPGLAPSSPGIGGAASTPTGVIHHPEPAPQVISPRHPPISPLLIPTQPMSGNDVNTEYGANSSRSGNSNNNGTFDSRSSGQTPSGAPSELPPPPSYAEAVADDDEADRYSLAPTQFSDQSGVIWSPTVSASQFEIEKQKGARAKMSRLKQRVKSRIDRHGRRSSNEASDDHSPSAVFSSSLGAPASPSNVSTASRVRSMVFNEAKSLAGEYWGKATRKIGGPFRPYKRRRSGPAPPHPSFGKLRFDKIEVIGLNRQPGGLVINCAFMYGSGRQTSKTVPLGEECRAFGVTAELSERGPEIVLSVLAAGSDVRPLGMASFRLPEHSASSMVFEAPLFMLSPAAPPMSQPKVSLTYAVQYDSMSEISQCFKDHQSHPREIQVPPFSLPVTLEAVQRLLLHSSITTTPLMFILDLLYWERPLQTAAFLVLASIVCIFDLFLVTLFGGVMLLFLLGYIKYRHADMQPGQLMFPPQSPRNGQDGDVTVEGESGGPSVKVKVDDEWALGQITVLLWMLSNIVEWLWGVFTWRNSAETAAYCLAAGAGWGFTFFIPSRYLFNVGIVYLFTFQSLYLRFPLFEERFPPGRFAQMVLSFANQKLRGLPSSKSFKGVLKVTIKKARNLRNADTLSLSDPYVVVGACAQCTRTKVIKNSCNPKWDEMLPPMMLLCLPSTVRVQVWDYDANNEDFLGECTLNITHEGENEAWYELMPRKGVPDDRSLYITGRILLRYTVEHAKEGVLH